MNTSASPETVHELFNRAFALHQGNLRDAAKPLYEEVLARDPRHAHAIHSLGVIASVDGRCKEAIELFQRAISINGKDAIFYHNLARTLQADGRSTEAVQSLRKAVELNPEFLGAWQALAELHYSLNNTTEAARAIQKVADLQTKTAESHNQKGLALVKEKRLKGAVEEFRAGMACNPRGAGLYFNAGNVLSALGQHADAISCLTQAASLEPKTPRVYVFLSNAHCRKGDLDAALRARAKAWQLDPTLPDEQFEVSASPIVAHPKRPVAMGGTPTRTTTLSLPQAIQQAVERHNAGDGASAELLYRKVLEVNPVNADALHLLGVLLHQRGDHRGALELIDRVVVRGNASANVHSNRASVLISLGEFEAAETSGRRALEIDPTHKGAKNNVALVEQKRQELEAEKKSDESVETAKSRFDSTDSDTLAAMEIESLYLRAVELHKKGDDTEAEELCNAILRSEPTHPEALSVSGVLAMKNGKPQLAIDFFNRSIAINPLVASTHSNMSVVLLEQRRITEALASCDQALTLRGQYPEALYNRANVLNALQRFGDALADYDRALYLDPMYVDSWTNRSDTLRLLKRPVDALDSCDRALSIRPSSSLAHINRGLALGDLGRFEEAFESYNRGIGLEPNCPDAYVNLGNALVRLQQPLEALGYYDRALCLKWDLPEAHHSRSIALSNLDRFAEAVESSDQAIALKPDSPLAYIDRGYALLNLGRRDEAIHSYRQVVKIRPSSSEARFDLGFALLSTGNYIEGWELYESRKLPEPPSVPFPRWRGESIANASLLIIGEQGFGDQIQFCRYVTVLKTRGVGRITIVCRAELAALFRTLNGVDKVLAREEGLAGEAHDFWTFLSSLPFYCGTVLQTIPAALPYLYALPDRAQSWSRKLPNSDLRVGLAWKGNWRNENLRHRSVPKLNAFAALWRAAPSNTTFVSLQKGWGAEESLESPVDQPIVHLESEINDFADTAAIIAELDLVICVDTAVAHLAGALNKPCWLMLSQRADWRWMLERKDSPWYPGVVRLFRQNIQDNWAPVIDELASALRDFHPYVPRVRGGIAPLRGGLPCRALESASCNLSKADT